MTGAAPAVSVVLATCDGALFLGRQLDSLAAQTLKPCELIVADDGSTDETASLIGAFAARAPFPVRLTVNPARLGYRANFMAGAQRCTGDLIAFCDQDDIWASDKLETMAQAFAEADVLLAVHDDWTIDDRGRRTGRIATRLRTPWDIAPGHTQLLRASLLQWAALHAGTLDPFEPGQPMAHDQFFVFWAAALGKMRTVRRPLVFYRQHPGQLYGRRLRPWDWLGFTMANAGAFARAKAAAARNRLDLLARAEPNLSDDERGGAHATADALREVLPVLDARAALHGEPRVLKRLARVCGLLTRGAYLAPTAGGPDLYDLAADLFVGLPLGPGSRNAVPEPHRLT